jgi:hypothetical protein
VNTTILAEELSQLSTQIEQTRQRHAELLAELRVVDAEVETFADDRQRFDALRDVCGSLDKLQDLNAGGLFWDSVANTQNAAQHLERVRKRIALFDDDIKDILEKKASLQGQINQCRDDLAILDEEVRESYDREERRAEEYVIEREFSEVPNRSMAMPWRKDTESEQRFRKLLRYAFLFYVVFCIIVVLWKLPPPFRPVVAVVPERLVSMLRKEPPKPAPVPDRSKEKMMDKAREKEIEKPKEDQTKPAQADAQSSRKKVEATGVLAFKDAFKDLISEAPAAKLGAEARLTSQNVAAGQARPGRSLVSGPGTGGSSGGIGNAGVSRNIGSGNGNRIGGVGFARVEGTIAGLGEGTKPIGSGIGPARTDEEIQIVFDKYKATLYRMYNAELRKNPTLRGKILLRITIEPGGEVSACTVQSTDLASQELVAQVVERVKKFNFGPKEKVPMTTILYPIDFLPGGSS